MKKILTLVALAISIMSATAGNGKSITTEIRKQLNVPAALKSDKLNEKVNVQFSLTPEGKVTVVNVETKNPELKNYIITQFPKIIFNSTPSTAGMYFVDINFKVL